ncbi:uncharacterized protein BKA55DRAFT_546829 [Fusarium redolens]|uniref:Uncharacterized protein n=1 Tax=Fusarium redolens TaxID=48865 RepID=A0A9P9FVS9_FUSRE|nr:uncharacterized protein BKA55DRAFT_546829 [Fusarium redolens]KAH7210752.1 hypothetical protein BKA55DRAFT_546829 [Fusarium redolens]
MFPFINNARDQNPTKHFLFYSNLRNIFYITVMDDLTAGTHQATPDFDADEFLAKVSSDYHAKSRGVLKSHFHRTASHIVARKNGFILAAKVFYQKDCAIIIRADNIWLAILAQLTPWIYQAAPVPENQHIPTFTPNQLDNPVWVARYLSHCVEIKFGPQATKVLMPDFCTTTPADATAAALILLGTPCTNLFYLAIETPKKHPNCDNVFFRGDSANWYKMYLSLEALGTWSTDLNYIALQHQGLLHSILTTGENESWSEFWKNMIIMDPEKSLMSGWLFAFFNWYKHDKNPLFPVCTGMPSAVASLPIMVSDDQGVKNCTMVGGLAGISVEEPDVIDCETDIDGVVQPMSGWLVYLDKDPEPGE